MFSNIYVITNKINNKQYVGQSVDVDKRWISHKFASTQNNTNIILYNAMSKYGVDNFVIQVIEKDIPINEIDEKEKYWINKLNTLKPNGYNMTLGGEGSWGRVTSKSTKNKISKKAKERYLNMTDIEKEDFINRLPKDAYDLKKLNEGYKYWINNCPIEERQEIIKQSIVTKKEIGYDFYNFSFGKMTDKEKESMYNKISKNNPRSQNIEMIDDENNIIKEFHSIGEASRYLHNNFGYSLNSKQNIRTVLDSDKKAYNFKWKRK
ncbi:GIY-YIG nuclease family protein [Methanoculleus sp.]|uniref:GIY-YIG nuclease family protein n=1 Tax=Methanoculleus sp. TaxID=90427 RepID=UPI0025DE11A5|nr:GIY-YIG nuclease family protein [Methanoculleus sp.]MCK9319241.1 GIY-YIG nuclease family protein [Methanoculleus sp.]